MNSLDALIAMLILLTSIGLIIGALGEQEKNFEQIKNNVNAKMGALTCMSVIDGMYSNSTDSYETELDCFVDGDKIKSTIKEIEKVVSVIPKIKKEHFLEVDTSEHYK